VAVKTLNEALQNDPLLFLTQIQGTKVVSGLKRSAPDDPVCSFLNNGLRFRLLVSSEKKILALFEGPLLVLIRRENAVHITRPWTTSREHNTS
jgi:hypothetical protein